MFARTIPTFNFREFTSRFKFTMPAFPNRFKFRPRMPTFRRCPALKWQGGNDYQLLKGQDTAWIQIDDYSVYVRRTKTGIAVEIIDHKEGGELDTIAETGIIW